MESDQPAEILYPDWPSIWPGEPYLYFNNTYWAYIQIIDLLIVVEKLNTETNTWEIYAQGTLNLI